MPWKKTEPMEQRIEFALKALWTLNFRGLCQENGVSAKNGDTNGRSAFCGGSRKWGKNRAVPKAVPEHLPENDTLPPN